MSEVISKKAELLVSVTPEHLVLLNQYLADTYRLEDYLYSLLHDGEDDDVAPIMQVADKVAISDLITTNKIEIKCKELQDLILELNQDISLPENEFKQRWEEVESLRSQVIELEAMVDKKLVALGYALEEATPGSTTPAAEPTDTPDIADPAVSTTATAPATIPDVPATPAASVTSSIPATPDNPGASGTPSPEPFADTVPGSVDTAKTLADEYRSGSLFRDDNGRLLPIRDILTALDKHLVEAGHTKKLDSGEEVLMPHIKDQLISIQGVIYDLFKDRDTVRDNKEYDEEPKRADIRYLNDQLNQQYEKLADLAVHYLENPPVKKESKPGKNPDAVTPIPELGEVATAFIESEQKYRALIVELDKKPEWRYGRESLMARAEQTFSKVDEVLEDKDIKSDGKRKKRIANQLRRLNQIINELEAGVATVGVDLELNIDDTLPDPALAPDPVLDVDLGKIDPLTLTTDLVSDPGILPADIPPPPPTSTFNPNLKEDYKAAKAEIWENKESFRNIEKAYRDGLKNYYENQSNFGKAWQGTRNLFGLNSKLPAPLAKLQQEYREVRKTYASDLMKALELRSYMSYMREDKVLDNNKFSSSDDKTKRAFGTKFILQPQEYSLTLQENILRDQEAKSRFHRLLKIMGEHKKITRAVGLTVAAGIGAATGGALGASFGFGRWVISTTGGVAAAAATYKKLEGNVLKAEQKNLEVQDFAAASFSLDDFNAIEASLVDAEQAKSRAALRQKVGAAGAAVAVGGAVGFGTSFVSFSPDTVEAPVGKSGNTLASQAVEPVTTAVSQTEVPTASLEDQAPDGGGETKMVFAGETLANEPQVVVKSMAVPFTGVREGVLSYQTEVSDIALVGDLKNHPIPFEQQVLVDRSIKLAVKDLLETKPHMPKEALEASVFDKLQAKYRTEAWWAEAKISKLNIGEMKLEPLGTQPVEVVTAAGNNGEASAAFTKEYTVKAEDTLSGIVEKEYASKLENVPLEKRSEVLEVLLEKVKSNPELVNSLELRSGDDINLIYPEEKLNLTEIGKTLDYVIEREAILENFRQTGPLSIAADEAVQNVPIKVIESQIPGGTAVTVNDGPIYSEAAPEPAKLVEKPMVNTPPVPPKPISLNGEYVKQPQYQEYIRQVFGTEKAFEQAVERAVTTLDNQTYDFFDRSAMFGGGNLESPYGFLADMSLQEVEEFKSSPNEEIRAFLQTNNIKYDTYLAWVDTIDELKEKLPHQNGTTVEDLFSRHVAESKFSESTKA